MVIDFHTHTFAEKIAAKALANLSACADMKPKTDGTLSDLKRSMKRNNIDYSVVLPVATKASQVVMLNDMAAQINGKDNLFSFGTIHHEYEDWKNELKRVKELGLPGIKIHHDYIRLFFNSEQSVSIIKEALSLGLMVLIHAGNDPVSKDIHYCTPPMIKECLPEFKGGTLIAAHYGGLCNLDEVEKYLLGEDIYIDTSMTHYYFGLYRLRKLLEAHNPDRILFGTDSPWEDQGVGLHILKNMGLSEDLLQKIMWDNGARLLDL